MKIVWHKHNLMIYSSVCSGHPGKYSYEIPHEYFSGWGDLSGIRDFFSNGDFSSHICCDFFRTAFFFFGEAASSHFFKVTTSTHQLLFRSSYFFRAPAELLFQNSHFFRSSYFSRIATFPEQNLYRAVTFWEFKVL